MTAEDAKDAENLAGDNGKNPELSALQSCKNVVLLTELLIP
jgi:hypothetical protein